MTGVASVVFYGENMAQNTDRSGIFRDPLVDLNVKALRGHDGAVRADPPTPGGSGVEEERPSNEPARKDGQRRERPSAHTLIGSKTKEHHRYIYSSVSNPCTVPSLRCVLMASPVSSTVLPVVYSRDL